MDTHTEELHDHDKGLSHDLPRLLSRRRTLALFGGAGLAAVTACATGDDSATSGSTGNSQADQGTTPGGAPSGTASEDSATVGDSEIPEETGGPYPADGSNGVNVLVESGIVRSDITSSFGAASGVAEGVPLSIDLTVVDVSEGSVPLAGAAVYLWHCNRDGEYSLYSQNIANENYLRGVQEVDAEGKVQFTSIFPAAYSGRWPHIHFEVYESLSAATSATGKLRTTQLALPEEICNEVFATDGYEQSVRNLAQTSLDSDNVFSDGYSLQLATIGGTVQGGLTASLTVPV